MEATQIWVLSGVLGLVLVVLGFLTKNLVNNIVAKLENIVVVLTEIRIALNGHAKDIEYIKDRLQTHEDRIHELEKSK